MSNRAVPLLAALIVWFPSGTDSEAASLSLSRTVVLDGLKSPWSIAFIGETDVLITEKEGGLIRANLDSGAVTRIDGMPEDRVSDIRTVNRADNGGLFDVVLDPAFPEERWIYFSYAARSSAGRTTKVIRARLVDDYLADHEVILVAEPYTEDEYFHYGGGLAFGADGMLYVTVGERLFNEVDGPELPIAQDVPDRRGKIYRINADGTAPDDNPDFGPDAPAGLYAIGIRAAQGITLHPETGELWFSEHGSRQGDEINRLRAGANYGWPIVTDGGYRSDAYEPPDLNGRSFTDPEWSWAQTVAPTGLTFYYGSEFPEWRGSLFVSGLSRGSLWRIGFDEGTVVSVEELFVSNRIRSRKVAVSPGGRLYMLTDTLLQSGDDGELIYTGKPGGQLLRISRSGVETNAE